MRRLPKALAFTSAALVTSAVAFSANASWTVMVYMEADNTLAPFAPETFKELEKLGSNDDVQLVVQLDQGNKNAVPGVSKKKGVQRILVKKGSLSVEQVVPDDMTTSQGLANFITWAQKNHAADHYALVLWDHGAGWMGCCEAETPNDRGMALETIASGLKLGLKNYQYKLDLMGFDECLMANLEVAEAIEPYVDIMVASEELEPGEGMNYDKWITKIKSDPKMKPVDVGKAIAKAYAENVEENSGEPEYTLSVIQTSKVAAVRDATEAFAKELVGGKDWSKLAAARAHSPLFGGPDADAFGLVDLGGFAKNVKAGLGSDAADDVLKAIDAAVASKVAGPVHKDARGISIYLPARNEDSMYPQVEATKDWGKFVQQYVNGAADDTTPPDVEVDEPSQNGDDDDDTPAVKPKHGGDDDDDDAPKNHNKKKKKKKKKHGDDDDDDDTDDDTDYGPGGGGNHDQGRLMFQGKTVGKDIKSVSIVLAEKDGNDQVFLGEIPLDNGGATTGLGGDVKYSWNGTWPMLDDGSGAPPHLEPLFAVRAYVDGDKKYAILSMPVEFAADGSSYDQPVRITFQLDLDTNDGKVMSAYSEGKGGAGQIKLDQDGARIRPFRITVNEHGDYTYAPGKDTFPSAKLALKGGMPEQADFWVGMHVVDYAGNATTKLVSIAEELKKLGGDDKGDGKGGDGGGAAKSGCACKKGCAIEGGSSSTTYASPAMGALLLAGVVIGRRASRPSRRAKASRTARD